MNFKEKKKRRNLYFAIMGIVLLIFLVKKQLNYIREGVNNIVLPVKILVHKSTENIKNGITNLKDIDRIIKENEELKKENFRLKMDNRYLVDLEKENKRLKEILDIKSSGLKDFIVASISFKDPMSVYDEFIIDKGSQNGVKENMKIMYRDFLLGRVVRVYRDKAIVELLSKSEKYTSVVVGKEKHLAILKGKNSNKLDVENIETDTNIYPGDKVYTSGVSELYPKDYYIGQVSKVETKKEQLFKKIELTLPFNIFDLNEVMVIK